MPAATGLGRAPRRPSVWQRRRVSTPASGRPSPDRREHAGRTPGDRAPRPAPGRAPVTAVRSGRDSRPRVGSFRRLRPSSGRGPVARRALPGPCVAALRARHGLGTADTRRWVDPADRQGARPLMLPPSPTGRASSRWFLPRPALSSRPTVRPHAESRRAQAAARTTVVAFPRTGRPRRPGWALRDGTPAPSDLGGPAGPAVAGPPPPTLPPGCPEGDRGRSGPPLAGRAAAPRPGWADGPWANRPAWPVALAEPAPPRPPRPSGRPAPGRRLARLLPPTARPHARGPSTHPCLTPGGPGGRSRWRARPDGPDHRALCSYPGP